MELLVYVGFNFILYSFIGWIIEEMYSLVTVKFLKKDGFLLGPFKPMYGTAMTILVVLHEIFLIDGISLIILCFLVPTIVEYISGYLLKHAFNKSYWNYSTKSHNIHGYVCLKFSIYWTFLSFIGVNYVQPYVHNEFLDMNGSLFRIMIFASMIIMGADLIFTISKINHSKVISNRV